MGPLFQGVETFFQALENPFQVWNQWPRNENDPWTAKAQTKKARMDHPGRVANKRTQPEFSRRPPVLARGR